MALRSSPSRAGIQFNEIPYKDVGQAAVDLIAGRLSVTFLDTVAAAQHVLSRSLKPLAATSGKRLDIYPDVPALAETFPGTEVLAFLSVSVPKEVPRDIQEKLNVLVNGTTTDPAILPRFEPLGLILRQLDLAGVDAFVAEERKRWSEYVAIAGSKRNSFRRAATYFICPISFAAPLAVFDSASSASRPPAA